MATKELAFLGDTSLLTAEDLGTVVALGEELGQTFRTVQVFRTRTEMELSVLNDFKHPTPDAKYWQAVREQNVHFQELVGLSFDYRKNQVELRQLRNKAETESDPDERELLEIEAERLEWMARQMEQVAHHRVREIRSWSEIKAELRPLMRCGTEDVNEHQLDSLSKRFSNQAAQVGPQTPPADRVNLLGLDATARRVKEGKKNGQGLPDSTHRRSR